MENMPFLNNPNLRTAIHTWLTVVIFAIAFAWVESAIVVYLRDIFFNGNFDFPLVVKWEGGQRIVSPLIRIEFFREIATIIMLATVGILSGKNRMQRFCYFLIAFGVWDIFYYIWLYVMVDWPSDLLTWDLLFYVPLPWVGPVITPVLIAVAMVIAGSLLIYLDENDFIINWRWYDFAIEFVLAILLIIAFCWDWKNILQIPGNTGRTGIPNPFAWWLYLPAYVLACIYFGMRLKQATRKR
jgi:hypothetical protein